MLHRRLQSLHALLWATLWLAPAWSLVVRFYEELELEIRFGEPYLRYKARTPFFGFWAVTSATSSLIRVSS